MRIAPRRPVLALVVVAGLAGCPARLDHGGAGSGSRRFYLTKGTFKGNKVLDACGRGYHTASRFELVNVSLLRYDATLGLTSDDSGTGPPGKAAAYGAEDAMGWVRTGGSSRFTDVGHALGSAFTNCSAWSTDSADALGTVAYLSDRFTSDAGSPESLWNGGAERCSVPHHVWCIEDRATEAVPEEEAPQGRRWRHGPE